jgi:hypothetical protein
VIGDQKSREALAKIAAAKAPKTAKGVHSPGPQARADAEGPPAGRLAASKGDVGRTRPALVGKG